METDVALRRKSSQPENSRPLPRRGRTPLRPRLTFSRRVVNRFLRCHCLVHWEGNGCSKIQFPLQPSNPPPSCFLTPAAAEPKRLPISPNSGRRGPRAPSASRLHLRHLTGSSFYIPKKVASATNESRTRALRRHQNLTAEGLRHRSIHLRLSLSCRLAPHCLSWN
jgi:hypothetical protein